MVSVILTSYNHGKFLREAIESVLAQTFYDFELIIWDDASDDDSWEIISSYADQRVKAFRNTINMGPVFGVNKAISEIAKGEYIAIHHSDDVWESTKLEQQVAFLEVNPDVGAVFSDALAIDECGAPLTDQSHFYYDIFAQSNRTRHEWLRFFFYDGNALCHPSILIRKKCYDHCGKYLDLLFQLPDLNMWIRLCMQYEIHVMPQKLVRFRIRALEMNTSGPRPETRIRGTYEFGKAINSYLEIDDHADIFKIFPSMARLELGHDTDIGFVVAMACFEAPTFCAKQMFGLDVLYIILSDPARAKAIKEKYGFVLNDFIALTGKYDLFSTEEVSNLRQSLVERDAQIAALLNSISWRLTRPLRAIVNLLVKSRVV